MDQSGDRSVSASPVRVVKGGDEEDEFIVHPRRKAGQPKASGLGKGPIVLTHQILEKYFDLPLVTAAEKLVGHRDMQTKLRTTLLCPAHTVSIRFCCLE